MLPEPIVEQLQELRKSMVELFDHDGWTVERCEVVEKLERAIALLTNETPNPLN
jgi:hypothetical protein